MTVFYSADFDLNKFAIFECMCNYPYSGGILAVRTDPKLSKHYHFKLRCSGGLLVVKTFETHQIHFKLPYSAGLLVVPSD